ncbi:MAG: 16S rRNA processing protein RimM [Syntrophus sp. (in: bacteria)]|nr:16S rRNA processing protein RimM [Syntrophus sp. (in: bacteria)]
MKYIPVGKVVATYGVKGAVKFKYYNDIYDNFYGYTSLYVKDGSRYTRLEPTEKRFHNGFFYIGFKGFETPEEVFCLLSRELFVREEDLPCLETDEYYDYQLIGLDVVDRKHVKVGKVKDLMHMKTNDLLVVVGEEEIFIPLTEEFVCAIDLQESKIVVDESALLV